jgi:hypothetical protein
VTHVGGPWLLAVRLNISPARQILKLIQQVVQSCLPAIANIDHLANPILRFGSAKICINNIFDVGKVARLFAITEYYWPLPAHESADETRNHA